MIRIDDIIDSHQKKHPDSNISLIQRAYIYSAKQHEGQLRKSGKPYMIHPLEVAKIIADMGLDEASICAALLHDTIEDTDTTTDTINRMFGENIAALVDGVTKLSGVNFSKREERQAESFRKLLVAMAKDIRVLLIKLADRLHNMRTLEHMSAEAKERISEETRDIYAPLADRLGISWMKMELDDLAFQHLETPMYESLLEKVNKTTRKRDTYIQFTIKELSDLLIENGFHASVTGRLKSLYSIYKKMRSKDIEYEDVFDALAFRVTCENVRDCYGILGLIHSKRVPVPGRFKDFIAIPKPNRYQSLHTTVVGKEGERVEIQIRTEEMHRVAEYGIAAHWAYKEGKSAGTAVDGFSWLREMLESKDEVRDSKEFLDSVKVNLFRDEVFAFTPHGDVKSLQKGATALDFAYAVHSEVGNQCVGARINGAQVPLRTELHNGDMVEIITSKTQRPSSDWLDVAVTSKALNKIKSYLRAEQRNQSRAVGQGLIEKALRRYGCSYSKLEKAGAIKKVAADLRFGNVEDLLAAVGYGKVDKAEVVDRLLPDENKKQPPQDLRESPFEKVVRKVKKGNEGILLDGVDNLLVHFARCCNPLPGEDIIGYVSHGRGIVVHRRNCSKAAAIDPERYTTVQWSPTAMSQHPVKLRVITNDRPGILAAIGGIFNDLKVNLESAHCDTNEANQGVCIFTFMVRDLPQLNHVTNALKKSRYVLEVERI